MKKVLFASLISAAMVPAVAMADTKNFEGFSAGLNLNLISAGVKISGDGSSIDGLGGKQTQSASLDLSYGLKISPNAVLGIGLDFDLTKPKILQANVGSVDGEVKQKNRYTVYLAPGYVVTKDALIYGKVGYSSMKAEGDAETLGSDSLKFNGYTYGLGSKIMVSKDTFIKIEAARYTFKSKSVDGVDFKPSATVGTIGIGMNF